MRLIALSANKSTFRTVKFNRNGLSIVVGQKKVLRDGSSSKSKTYNGVGKSLLLQLVHYCLASDPNDAFRKHLDGWIFSLEFELQGNAHRITRSADKPSELSLDGEKITLPKLRTWLLAGSFYPQQGIQGLTFRSLILPFIRSGRAAYDRFDRAGAGDAKNEYWALVRNAFLLGLDLNLLTEKHRLRLRQTQLDKTVKQLESDPVFADVFADDKASLELVQLREEALAVEARLRNFQVADDYTTVQETANGIKRQLESVRRELVKTQESIAQVDRSLGTRSDLDPRLVEKVYAEANVAFPDAVKRSIAEVLEFQRQLTQQRIYRLTQERQSLELRRVELERELRSLSPALEHALRYLGSHVALDEFLVASERLSSLRQQAVRLQTTKEQRERVKREMKSIDVELAEQTLKAEDFLVTATALVEEAAVRFRSYSMQLYPQGVSGLTVANDSGANQLRYRIEAHIPRDAAEGINEAKIFCYDLTLLTLRRGHQVEFLAHDSSLFSPIDHRQRLGIFRLVDRAARANDIQYIATLNEHDITSMRPSDATELAEFDALFSEPNIVLRLTDNSARERLLGIDVDMNYWESRDARSEDVSEA